MVGAAARLHARRSPGQTLSEGEAPTQSVVVLPSSESLRVTSNPGSKPRPQILDLSRALASRGNPPCPGPEPSRFSRPNRSAPLFAAPDLRPYRITAPRSPTPPQKPDRPSRTREVTRRQNSGGERPKLGRPLASRSREGRYPTPERSPVQRASGARPPIGTGRSSYLRQSAIPELQNTAFAELGAKETRHCGRAFGGDDSTRREPRRGHPCPASRSSTSSLSRMRITCNSAPP
jgi:hypothetical protein